MKTLFEQLKQKYGDHSKAAKALGLEPRVYRRIRNQSRKGMKDSLKKLAELLLQQPKE